jgi:hypothetical protein
MAHEAQGRSSIVTGGRETHAATAKYPTDIANFFILLSSVWHKRPPGHAGAGFSDRSA